MVKNSVQDWSETQSMNTDIGGTNIAEHCALSGMNDAIRKIMSQAKEKFNSVDNNVSTNSQAIQELREQTQNIQHSSTPATSEKTGTVKLLDEIPENLSELGEDAIAVSPSAIINYVQRVASSDYGELLDEESNYVPGDSESLGD